jgi:hypothetical protein
VLVYADDGNILGENIWFVFANNGCQDW